ncbi:protein suppressor of sable isoform X2 [Anoplophora glabripennis]|uniref:protein suppressor of sable isoform X2 n=1 Tax=Anoplophora glabripennis TaxID=217634 RepID=UPI0008737EE3|nr:protein suppressor of sable isoform X2 [Anoplophora glabripennis]
MALVCDIKSNTPEEPSKTEEDLEDGEIEDDDEEAPAEPQEAPKADLAIPAPVPVKIVDNKVNVIEKIERDRPRDRSERRRHEEKGRKHMTEAEKSILHLRKREEMQRKKWEKFNRNKDTVMDPLGMESMSFSVSENYGHTYDDFAKNIEKTLATILNKKEKEAAAASGEEDKIEEKRGKKRKKGDKDRKNKQRRIESPKSEIDENEMLNIRGGSPEKKPEERREGSPSVQSEESYDSEYSSDRSRSDERIRRREGKKAKRNRDREHGRERKNRDRRNEQQPLKDSQGVCVFYLQGKCQKNDCPYSHEAVPPMKLELCKFYLMDCCAKGLNCIQGDNCKFAHGKPLSEGLKQILFKHLETAPRDILGGFPRMSREEALNLINITQIKLQEQQGMDVKEEPKGGIPSLFDINVPVPPELLQGADDVRGKNEKSGRNRPSRWQDPDPLPSKDLNFPLKPFQYGQDQDMRIRNSNGDIDMRTLPPNLGPIPNVPASISSESKSGELDLEKYKREAGLVIDSLKQDLDIRTSNILPYTASKDVDIRHQPLLLGKDVDIRVMPKIFDDKPESKIEDDNEDEPMLQIDTGDDCNKPEMPNLPVDLPKTQRDLYLRIQAQQKETAVEQDTKEGFEIDENINWYSDDDDEDDNRLTIKVDNDEVKEKEAAGSEGTEASEVIMSPPQIKPLDVVGQLGDLSKIDISAEVTKLLTTMSQSQNQFPFLPKPEGSSTPPQSTASTSTLTDPRTARQDPRTSTEKQEVPRADPRLTADPRQRSRQGSIEVQNKPEKLSIYEQGSIDRNSEEIDTDFRSSIRSDVDLRNLQLPFKGMQNYTPATEIDASINSHLPIPWKVVTVEIPRPDYTGLKLSISDAEKTGDPRLRKIFRLSVEERDTPLSPKASPKSSSTTVRVDPRLRKMEDSNKNEPQPGAMTFNQQLSMLQSSAFYQSLTSNQKLLLNQELSQRSDPNNSHDPVLNSLLSNLNIIPGTSLQPNSNLGAALSILANVSKLNPILPPGQQANLPVNPMLSQNPNIMNQMAQSVSQPGLLGAAPGIPNLPPDFPINFDPRNGGLLGNAPMPFGGFPPDGPGNFNNFNEDFYPPNNPGNRDNRGFNRDRRRGRNFNRNNPGNRNFRSRNNRANRTHSPP